MGSFNNLYFVQASHYTPTQSAWLCVVYSKPLPISKSQVASGCPWLLEIGGGLQRFAGSLQQKKSDENSAHAHYLPFKMTVKEHACAVFVAIFVAKILQTAVEYTTQSQAL